MRNASIMYSLALMGFSFGAFAQEDQEKSTQQIVFTQVERYPVYAGCEEVEDIDLQSCFDKKILEHISNNFTFPQSAKKAGVDGEVIVSFIIEKDGEVTDVTLFKGVEDNFTGEPAKQNAARDLENAAIKSIQDLEIVEPAMKAGKPVRMKYTIPIQARLKS